MSSVKAPVSSSYKAVFALSILMIFVVIIGGAMSGYKSVGFGVWYWGYTAWKMYKRDNDSLVSLQKVMLWFEAIAFALGLGVLLASSDDVQRYVDITPVGLLIIASVSMGLTYLLFVYFSRQKNDGVNSTSSTVVSSIISDKYWEAASIEFDGSRNAATWARCYSESDGNEAKAKAQYLKIRSSALSDLELADSNGTNVSLDKDSNKLNFAKISAWSLCVFVVAFGFIKVWNSNSASGSIATSSQPKPYNPIYSNSQIEAQNAPPPKITSCHFEWNSDTLKFDRLNDAFVSYFAQKSYVIPKLGYDALVSEKLALLRKADKEGNLSVAKTLAKEVQELTITIYHKAEAQPKSFMDGSTQAQLSALCAK